MSHPQNRIINYLLITGCFIIAVLIFISFKFLMTIPVIWPDESLFADASLNLLDGKPIGTGLLKGTLPGAEEFGFGYPPGYFYFTAAWFKLFGFSVLVQRLSSFFTGLLFLGSFVLLASKLAQIRPGITLSTAILSGSVILLLTDISVLKATHIARPEIQVLFLGFISLYAYLKSTEESNRPAIALRYGILTGVSLGLAFITHFLAVIYLLVIGSHILIFERDKLLKSIFFGPHLTGFGVIIIVWLVSIYQNIGYFLNDITLRLRYKTDAPYWLWIVFSSQSFSTKLLYILYFLSSWQLISILTFFRNRELGLLALTGIFTWIFTYLWQTEYSFVYVPVFVYLTLCYLAIKSLPSKNRFKAFSLGIYILSGTALLLNLYVYTSTLTGMSVDKNAYNRYIDQITAQIPENASVYMSALPDPYYGFKNRRNNELFLYPALPTEPSKLIEVLDRTDYIVINNPLERIVAGDIVTPYISKNAEQAVVIGKSDNFSATIVKLKPRDSRVH